MSLKLLIDNPDEVRATWQDQPARYHRNPAAFADLLTIDEVNDLVDSGCLAARNVVCVKDGKVIEQAAYMDKGADMPRPGAIREHLDGGGTISLRSLASLKPSLAQLQRDLQAETGYVVHVNAYLTPPGAQGLKYHYDPYLTLIAQVAGRKAWPSHSPFVESPVFEYGSFHLGGFTDEQRHFLEHTPPERVDTLEPGDVLWLPRGWVHSPYTVGEEPSLHLTIAFKERTSHWVAGVLAREVLAQALVDPAMREAVPPAELTSDPARTVDEMRAYLIGALIKMDPGQAAHAVLAAARRAE